MTDQPLAPPLDTDPATLVEEPVDLAGRLATLSATIRAGQDAVQPRAAAIRIASTVGWTQQRIAQQCAISQAAVSKILARAPGEISIEHCTDQHYLLGRLLRVAAEAGWNATHTDAGRGIADRLYEGRRPVTERGLTELRRQLDKHLARIGGGLTTRLRAALADIDTRTTGVPSHPGSIDQQQQMMLGWHHQGAHLFDGQPLDG